MLQELTTTSTSRNGINKGTLTIRGRELETETRLFDQSNLRFYVQNPRVYSVVREPGQEPTQETIEQKLADMEHVRELKEDIKRNGGLIDPVIVKPETREVLEGNSRLAAYRLLVRENPVKWGQIKCIFLPEGLDDKTIFALLGQYHIKGKKNWAPFEQAGFLYRRYKQHNIGIDELAKEIGLRQAEVKLLIDTYDFMMHHDKNTDRWSYYYEYLKSRKIKKARENYQDFDQLIVDKIKHGEISKATEVRDELPKITAGPPRILSRFVAGTLDFAGAIDKLVDSGADNSAYRRINKFRMWFVRDDVKSAIKEGTREERKRVIFELRKVQSRLTALLALKEAREE
ncbi:MAG TPA: hypothetical protein VFE16_08830 [Candidatus Cybelea sp.]|jgi:hypothetical protein|nr:hypothetical protein [Candidatus Cybelea sp.]